MTGPGRKYLKALFTVITAAAFFPGSLMLRAQQGGETVPDGTAQFAVEHPECTYFGPDRARFAPSSSEDTTRLNQLTEQVVRQIGTHPGGRVGMESLPGGSRSNTFQKNQSGNTIDKNLFADMQAAGIAPADKTNDFEFIRRVTLDLTGRIPTPDRVLSFTTDTAPDKRAKLIDELLGKPEWIDKWTMYFGDLLSNTTLNSTTGVRRYADGRDAFYSWIKQQLTTNRPYNQVAYSVIAATGTNSYDSAQGQINWMVNGLVTNGPVQDAYDQEAANTAQTFLGISHMNCTLCHNGRGHLDQLSLWGKNEPRTLSWGFAAFFAKTTMSRTPVAGATNNQPYYWSVGDSGAKEYTLNTLTGNRPARCQNNLPPLADANNNLYCACSDGAAPLHDKNNLPYCKAAAATVKPAYPFTGAVPNPGEDYRAAAARMITADFQFARATVNYMWAQFFGMGLVDPPDQFDVARLDPDNPPPDPWTLQPSHPRLLNALAQDFINSGYDLKALMREIASSDAYQLSARYNGTTPPDSMFARKLVRRLWGEEVHDAVVQSSGVYPSYDMGTLGKTPWAMQFPEPRGFPANAGTRNFLDAFLRGNRDDEERRPDGSLTQALGLMNDAFVVSRVKATGSGATASLLAKSLPMTDDKLVDNLWLNVLSRFPAATEKQAALAQLSATTGTRQQRAEDLLWSLYNKVDFIFNY